MLRHAQFAVRVAGTRSCGRLLAWALPLGRTADLAGLTPVLTAALGPDQAKQLHMARFSWSVQARPRGGPALS